MSNSAVPSRWTQKLVRCGLIGLQLAIFVIAPIATLSAQQPTRTLPNDRYYATFDDFYRGRFRSAGQDFRGSARGGYIGVNGPWVDAICYHAMVGECYYNVGEIELALEQYNAALELYVTNGAWLSVTEFPDLVQQSSSASSRARITWGTPSRDVRIGNFDNSIGIRISTLTTLENGTIVQGQELRTANIGEVMRCMAIAMRRRLEILGPAARFDEVNRRIVGALESAGVRNNHWARAWVDIPLALGKVAAGDVEQGAAMLQSRIETAGGLDHPLTPIAMLELGKIYFAAEQYDEAAQLFYETTFPATVFGQQDVLEEAFTWGTKTHLVQQKGGEYPPLAAALDWAQRNGSKQLVASLAISLAECHLQGGDTAGASALLRQVQSTFSRNEIGVSPIGARYQYQLAHAAFQSGNVVEGVGFLSDALQLQTAHGRWNYQIALVDTLFVGGVIPQRQALDLYDSLLRDPNGKDWQLDPLESFSVLLIPQPAAMEHWFEIAVDRRDHEKAMEVADRIRRRRFYQSLPLGGRLMALRWVLEAPREAVTPEAHEQRQEFMLRYPAYADLSNRSSAIVDQLSALPIHPPEDSDERAQQRQLLGQLGQIAATQEGVLSEIALRREPSKNEFPPLRPTNEVQAQLKEGQTAISYFSTSNSVFMFRLTKDDYAISRIERPATVRQATASLLRAIGCRDAMQAVDEEVLLDESWKAEAETLAEKVFPGIEGDYWDNVDELIVIPDGLLWYVPFELLQVGSDGAKEALIERVNIRYLPTTSLIVPDGRSNPARGKMAVVTGKLFPRDDAQVAVDAFDRLQVNVPSAEKLQNTLPGPSSLMIQAVDRLLVLDDIERPRNGIYGVSPMQLDMGQPGSDLSSWMALPFGGAEQIALPGFHTVAEMALRQRNVDGNEIFLTVCGMMSSGTRTALISRWRPGGLSSFELASEFMRELPEQNAMDSWRRSLDLFWRGEISPDLEPRVQSETDGAALDPKHPFFWAGFFLVDTGIEVVGAGDDDAADE